MAEFLQEYELSIWEDINSKAEGEQLGSFIEQKVAVIGAHNLDSSTKAYNVTLKENVNGEKTLTFNLPRMYRDKDGELVDNPFLSLLTAERKLKLRDGSAYDAPSNIDEIEQYLTAEDDENKWSDYVIKNIDEDREKYVNTYTCKEIFVNELGKNGWNIVLDEELMNNYGTLPELGEKVLDGSGWEIDVKGYNPNEKVNEPLFIAGSVEEPLTELKVYKKIFNGETFEVPKEQTLSNVYAYAFFSQLVYSDGEVEGAAGVWKIDVDKYPEAQLLIRSTPFAAADLDDNRVVIDDEDQYNYFITAENAKNLSFSSTGGTGQDQNTMMQGGKLVASAKMQYEPVNDKYVELVTVTVDEGIAGVSGTLAAKDDTVYHYTESEYVSPEMVQTLIANGADFITKIGWQDNVGLEPKNVQIVTYPKIKPDPNTDQSDIIPANYLKIPSNTEIYNCGPETHKISLKEGDKYVAMVRGKTALNQESSLTGEISVGLGYIEYVENTQKNVFKSVTDPTTAWALVSNSNYYYTILTVNNNVSALEKDLVFSCNNTRGQDIYIQNIQLFEYIDNGEGGFITPETIPDGKLLYRDHYYTINNNKEVIELPVDKTLYTPQLNGFTAVRSLSVKESNYFNNINSLAELFECWVKFDIKHCRNGELKRDENGFPIKKVKFSRYSPTGKDNAAGFRYGKNIKSIKRTVKSDTVASKLIVKNNNNEFATNGMASITRAIDNPIAENIVYNFDYYVAHGLLDQTALLQDLYGLSSGDFGYYRKIKPLNEQILSANQELVAAQGALQYAEEMLIMVEAGIEESKKEIADAEHELKFMRDCWGVEDPETEVMDYSHEKILGAAANLSTAMARYNEFVSAKGKYEEQVEHYKSLINGDAENPGLLKDVETIKNNKIYIDKQFYQKYSRYIQEATWTDEKYVDDNLYYYDAKKVSAQNAWPKTSYTIGAIEVSGSDKLAPYSFNIGDRSYIEDTEFFGYNLIKSPISDNDYIRTPVHKEVVVSERSRNFDDPSKSTISIKTYKNQFEDLFSKITATTQSLQYSSGEYQRAANAVDSTGAIKMESLESAFANNAFTLANTRNQSVSWDSGSGIEVKDLGNSAQLVRLASGVIALSTDGGKTWTTGISARGINTQLLTAGTINANNINIFSGASDQIFSFMWDENGVSATNPGTGGKDYVRFNNLGMFGTQNGLSLDEELNKVSTLNEKLALVNDRKYTTFALTWDGLKLAYQDGALSLEPRNGLEIFGDSKFSKDYLDKINIEKYNPLGTVYATDDYVPLISLGRYKDVNKRDVYGLRMRNNLGEVTLDTNGSDGNLWLKNSLTLGTKQVMVEVEAEDGTQVQEYVYRGTAGISGKIGDSNGTNYAFWAGDEGSPNFSVTHEGVLKAKGAIIEGQVTGNGLKIVDPNNDNKAIAGINNSNFTFWSGPITNDDGSASYNFSVAKDGALSAQGANISGTINATSGSFTGEIKASSGSIEKILFGDALQSYIGGGEEVVLNINNKFKVEQNGDFYGEILNLISYSDVNGDTKYRVQIGASNDKFVNINDNFIVDADGTVILTGKLNTANGLKLTNGDLSIGEDITISKGSIYNNNGTWNINADGTAVFNNATINGILQSTVFEHSTSSAIAGDMWIAPAFFAKDVTSRVNKDDPNKKDLLIPVPQSNKAVWEKVDSILIDNSTQPYPCSYSGGYLILTVSTAAAIQVEGKQIISQSSKVNNIKISANDENGPYISMTYLQNDNSSKVVLGNLTQIKSNKYFGDLKGHGLYADNAYLTGKLYLPNAGITNEGSDSTSVRIWAGSTPGEMSKAPFRVLQDGSLYASKGIFSGQVNAEDSYFSGILSAAGVILKDENKDTPEKEHQRFFFHYLTNGSTKHIGAIESDGVKMWEGGLAAYTIPSPMENDNGLQELAKTAIPVFETLNNDKTPRTYVDKLQIGGNQNWTSALDGSGLMFKRLKGTDYENIKKSYDGDAEAAILKTDEGLDIKASIINLKGLENSDNNATSIVKLTGTMEFNSTFEIETVEDGIVFNYIGD